MARFNLNLANFPEEKRVSWTKHQVKQGDSLNNIAMRYHTTVNLIKQLNQLTTNNIRPNQSILIPSTRNIAVAAKKEISPLLTKTHPLSTPNNRRIIHIVQKDDTFEKIQKTYGVSARAIQSWNRLASNKALHEGEQLIIWRKVKQPTQYIVRPGDSLSVIARLNHTQVNEIINLNPGLSKSKPLQPGQKILVG